MRFLPIVALTLAASSTAEQLDKGAKCASNRECEASCGYGEFQVTSDQNGDTYFFCSRNNPANDAKYICAECTWEGKNSFTDRANGNIASSLGCREIVKSSAGVFNCIVTDETQNEFQRGCSSHIVTIGRGHPTGSPNFTKPGTMAVAKQACS